MKAIQPVIAFPITKFGKQNRSFQASCYINWPLLQYDANKDCALCFYCSYRFISTNLNHLFDPAFVVNGMRNGTKQEKSLIHIRRQVPTEINSFKTGSNQKRYMCISN